MFADSGTSTERLWTLNCGAVKPAILTCNALAMRDVAKFLLHRYERDQVIDDVTWHACDVMQFAVMRRATAAT